MRVLLISSFLLLSAGTVSANDQTPSVSVQAGGGLTLLDTGHNLSAGVAFSPLARVTLLLGVERTHLETQATYGDTPIGPQVASVFRGGTMTAVSGTIRVSLFPEGRLTPYVLAGLGRGRSRPNVNEHFPTPVTNDATFALAGAGLSVPLRDRLSLFGDARMMIGAEGVDGMLVVAPVRVGVNWRF